MPARLARSTIERKRSGSPVAAEPGRVACDRRCCTSRLPVAARRPSLPGRGGDKRRGENVRYELQATAGRGERRRLLS